MIKITGIRIKAGLGDGGLKKAAARALGLRESDILNLKILKKSIDSRKKPEIYFVYSVAAKLKDEKRVRFAKNVSPYSQKLYSFPTAENIREQAVVVGMGPAGLFAALSLAEAGIKCTVLERGRPVEQRTGDVERFWRTGALDESSNVQFGEGGAGTFSDGKLSTGVNDIRIPYVFRRFAEFGAPSDIEYLSAPHIGTDNLKTVVANMRRRLLELGCDIRFTSRLCCIDCAGGSLTGITVEHAGKKYSMPCKCLILAPGNGARDTFRMLYEKGVKLSAKSFAVGVRIEHLQRDIDTAQYGEAATLGTLPASNYKLAAHIPGGRSVFTFCVCPGGQVVAAASENGRLVTNGMSEYARDLENINGGLLVGVTPEDYPGSPLAGIDLQISLEEAAYKAGGGRFIAPAQLVGDFLNKRTSTSAGKVTPSYRPEVCFCNLWNVLPEFICSAIAEALPEMDRKIRGFASPDAVLTAVETRSSCPVRIDRDGDFSSSVKGLFPCGEGAGYAGGITSAAVDGIKCAEMACRYLAEI